MKTKPPPDRRKFDDARDEMEYLYHKLLYWLYEREEPARARTFAQRLERLLANASPGQGAIFPEECWSIICEASNDLPGAIQHREAEIRLIKRLQEISQDSPQGINLLRLHGYGDLSDRLELLAILYHDNDQQNRAIESLQEANLLCAKHGIPFQGKKLLLQYLAEKTNSNHGAKGVPSRGIGLDDGSRSNQRAARTKRKKVG